jgi:hypothetical protein
MNRSVLPSLSETGRSAVASVLPGNRAESVMALSPDAGAKPAT